MTAGVQILSLHEATPCKATHVCWAPHADGAPNPLPSERQVTTELASQDELPAVQRSRAHAPFEQYSSGLQSVAPTQATQYPRAVSHKRPIFVHCVSELHF